MKQLLTIDYKKSFICLLAFFYCPCINAQQWAVIQGITAQDIAVGKNGSVWATGTNGAIYRWSGTAWQTMSGAAVRIAVDPDGAAWVVNAGNQIFKYNLTSNLWELKPGNAKDIAVGANGTVWIIGANTVAGGYDIYKWNGTNWSLVSGGAARIAVDPTGNAWVVNSSNNVFRFNGSAFEIKPGAVKDIGVGANGAIWCTGTDDRIYQWDGSNWKLQTGGAAQISVAPDGNAWAVNSGGQVWRTTGAVPAVVQIRTLFPRNQTYEYRMLQALKISPYSNTISLGGSIPTFSGIDPLGQAFGRLGLIAAEIYSHRFPNATAESVLSDMNNFPSRRQAISGVLAILVIDEIGRSSTDVSGTALKTWATDLFKSIKIRSAKAVLDEYGKWKADWCTYEGISAEECRVRTQGISSLFSEHKPPKDLIGKNGLKTALSGNADAIAVGVSLGVAAVTTAVSAAVLTSVMTAAGTAAASSVSLFSAFAGAGAGLGVGFAGVVAAPVAAAILCVVVGTIEGFAVVEATKLEPMLKMKLGAAMTDYIRISNVMADTSSRNMFFIAFQESALNGFKVPETRVDGEVRFYCQAGYVSSFKLSYTANGQNITKTTADLAVGNEETFPIPYNATNIRVQGWYALAGWKELFNQTLAQPTYVCYTSYGTVFDARYKTDCPEVGSMTTKPNELTVTQGGGYAAWVKLTYTQNGQTVTKLDESGKGIGWRQVFQIPTGTTNIRLQAWTSTGLVWDPWKSIIDKTWPVPPNECIKVYGTTLDPKWNNECN